MGQKKQRRARRVMRLRALRRGRELTLAQLGERVGLSAAMVGHIEAGIRRPSPEKAAEIAAVFGEPVERLFKFVEVPA